MKKFLQRAARIFTIAACMLFPGIVSASMGELLVVPSSSNPTITAAMIKAKPGDTVMLENGKYREKVFIKAGVALKARTMHKAIISGKGRGVTVTMGSNSAIIGCVVTNGTIGIFTKNPNILIKNCQIVRNWMTGLMSVRQLPQIEDNIIAFNRGSGFQGWDVRSTNAALNHNTIAYNGNHGLAIGGTSTITAENNIIAFNERFGLKLSKESDKSKITNNDFFRNLTDVKIAGNHNFDPAFVAKRALNFKLDPRLCCNIKSTDNENLGVRYEY